MRPHSSPASVFIMDFNAFLYVAGLVINPGKSIGGIVLQRIRSSPVWQIASSIGSLRSLERQIDLLVTIGLSRNLVA